MKSINASALLGILIFSFVADPLAADTHLQRPNILWITLEDISPDLGCYGDSFSVTPNIEALAQRSVRYTHAWSNAGMCATARATLITGIYPPSTGAQNMRSDVRLPEWMRAFPEYLRDAGYYCSNHVKTDYNWQAPESTWDRQHRDWADEGWRQRASGQPFFTVINITDTHSSQLYYRGEKNWKRRVKQLPPEQIHDPAKVNVPPYYPDTPEVRGDLARYYDNISFADGLIGKILQQLKADGLAEETIVFLFSDHGRGMPRSKSWCFETSLRVPLIVHFPETYRHLAPAKAGNTLDRLVSFVDFAPTVLSLCGVEIPEHLHGSAFLGEMAGPVKRYAFAYRDRMDERYELIRAITDGRFKFIRNYYPHLPWFHDQTRNYPRLQPTYAKWHELAHAGELSGHAETYMAHSKPREQLFDLANDPYELENLAGSPEHQQTLERLRGALQTWMVDIVDLGFMPEAQWFTRFEDTGDRRPRHTIVRESSIQYPLQQIMALADSVGLNDIEVMQLQGESPESSDPATRYWAAVGLLAQASLGSEELAGLTRQLKDPIPSCRIAAAKALLTHAQQREALETLAADLGHHNLYVSLLAANALEHVGAAAYSIADRLHQATKSEMSESDESQAWIVASRNAILDRIASRAQAESYDWVNLISSDLSKWRGYQMAEPPVGWVVKDGVVSRTFMPGQEHAEFVEGGGDLITREMFGDFELEFEYKINEGGNSGVIYRLTEEEPRSYWSGPEYQILERANRKRDPAFHFCGANYALDGPPEEFSYGPDTWNRGRIVARGNQIEHWLNGHRTAAYEIDSASWNEKVVVSKFKEWSNYAAARRGHIALQDHGAPVAFRKVRIRELKSEY